MDTTFSTISSIIKSRRSTKPVMMNGKKILDDQIHSLLELADWAPTHGFTEPWRFVVYANPTDFCHQHAEMYRKAPLQKTLYRRFMINCTSRAMRHPMLSSR